MASISQQESSSTYRFPEPGPFDDFVMVCEEFSRKSIPRNNGPRAFPEPLRESTQGQFDDVVMIS